MQYSFTGFIVTVSFITCRRSYEITFWKYLRQTGTDWDENLQGDVGSRVTLSCKLLTTSGKRAQNGGEKNTFSELFYHQNNASFHSLPGDRCPWNLNIKRESMSLQPWPLGLERIWTLHLIVEGPKLFHRPSDFFRTTYTVFEI